MNRLITPIFDRPARMSTSPPANTDKPGSFNEMLTGYLEEIKPPETQESQTEQPILVGKITPETPTVSELLIRHKELGPATWDIIYSEKNQGREYTKIRSGTLVYYNQQKGTLSWSGDTKEPLGAPKEIASLSYPPAELSAGSQRTVEYHNGNDFSVGQQKKKFSAVADTSKSGLSVVDRGVPATGERTLSLGRINSANPTVSHLLKNHPLLREHAWNVLASGVNKNKPFQSIANGTEISLNTENMEITWKDNDTGMQRGNRHASAVTRQPFLNSLETKAAYPPAIDLSEAVKRYLGTSYDELNCYELLVKGLGEMNIPYRGKDGLFNKLTRMALDSGMAPNAYLNGEGVVKAAGALVLSKKYADLADWRGNAETLIKELEPLLDNGQILSFSTENRGHTGVVSRQNKQWTFINSGRLDNSVYPGSVHRGVGEEVLQEEIINWFKLAHAKGESLSVTLGRVEQDKIHTAFNIPQSSSNQT
ncbi:MAG: hypothetical protein ACWGOX_01040 [Desulforhopalus sp.]